MELKEKYESIKADWTVKWYGFKWNFDQKFKATINWCSNNKELTIAFLAAFGVAVRTAGKTISSVARYIALEKEEKRHELEVYDHSIGKWQKLRRPMNHDETVEFAQRKRSGESTVEILEDFGILRH